MRFLFGGLEKKIILLNCKQAFRKPAGFRMDIKKKTTYPFLCRYVVSTTIN